MKARILALALCFVMIFSIMPTSAFAAEGTDGSITITATKTTVNVGDTFDLVFKANAKTDPLGALNFTVNLPDGLEYVSHEMLFSTSDFMMSSYIPETGVFGCAVTMTGKGGNFDVLKITVRAKETNVGANTVSVELGSMGKVDGVTKMDFGTVTPLTITTKSLAAVKDGSVSMSATKDTLTIGETVDVTVKVKADTDPLGAINFTVNLPAGLEYVSHELLYSTSDFMMGSYTASTGVFGCGVTSAGKSGEFDVLKLTLKATENNIGANDITITLGNMGKVDGITKMDFGTVEPITITTKAPVAVKDGSVSMSATKNTITVGDTVDVTVTVKADTDPLGAINFTVNLPAGLEYVSHELLYSTSDFMMGSYTASTGVFGCGVTSAGKSGEFDVLKLTLKATDNNIGDNKITITLGNMGKVDGITKMDFGTVEPITITTKAPAHICSNGVEQAGLDKTCTTDGYKAHYKCSCGKLYEEAACINEITNLDAWKKGEGKIPAGHDYGTLVPEEPAKHTATEQKDGMKAHFFCATCNTYFDSSMVATTKEALTIKNQHSYTTQYGYKEIDGHADTCVCGAHNTVVGHTPNISAPTETEDQVCKFCGFVINPKTGHIHKNNLTPVAENGATCTEEGYKAHYKCSCGEYFEDASASVEIPDIDAWKAGKGKIAAEGHKYTEQIKDAAHLKSEATKCTEFDVYWYDCSVCDANAKNDPNATDKFWTSTDAGDHKFDEKLTDAAHLVAGTGANCQDAKKYYFDCAYCAEIGTSTWTSDSYGDHNFTEKLADAAHLVAGTGANCQDAKEYYYDCVHCAEIGTTSWVSTEMGDHEFVTTEWGYKDVATGHAHKCKYCTEHDTVQPHTPGAPATETEDQICTTCLLVLEPATGHICKSHLTKVAAEPATCTKDGNIEYYTCSCGKWYTDATASVEITDKDSVVIKAGHNYGTIVAEEPAVHTATELKAGMKAHYFCDVCDTYFTAEKVATTESELIIPAPVHEYNTVNGYKEADGHADTCSCGAHNTVVGHTPDIPAPTETQDQKCSVCGYVLNVATGHICQSHLTKVPANGASCTVDGNIEYYECSCGKYYTDATAAVEITDKESVVIKASHNYGTLIEEDPAVHTPTELKAGMKAHYFCDVCDTYFTADKVATTESELVIPAPVHEYNTVNGYKEADGHADTCSCGAHNTVVPHTPDREAATENDPIKCSVCGYEIAPALGHIHKNNLTKVPAETADCEKDGNIEYYNCSCGKYYTDATASVEITDKDSVVIKGGHKYGELVQEEPAVHTATEKKDGMKAHYFCDECDTYFTADKVATTKDALVIANAHSHGTEWKSDKDNHWNECACGDKANSAAHKDENSDGKCDVCEYNVGTPGGDKPNDNPQTGDNSNMILWISLLMLSALGIVATTVIGKKKYSVK